MRKINVDTDNRLAITGAIRKVFAETPEKFDPRDYLGPAREAMKKVCDERMIAFGQAGNAGKIKAMHLQARWSPSTRRSNQDQGARTEDQGAGLAKA